MCKRIQWEIICPSCRVRVGQELQYDSCAWVRGNKYCGTMREYNMRKYGELCYNCARRREQAANERRRR